MSRSSAAVDSTDPLGRIAYYGTHPYDHPDVRHHDLMVHWQRHYREVFRSLSLNEIRQQRDAAIAERNESGDPPSIARGCRLAGLIKEANRLLEGKS